jgi:hypothetical protein
MSPLSPVQDQIIAALSSGVSLTAAADAAGIHRNTISNWLRISAPFRAALAEAQYDRALFIREQAESLADIALQTIREILTDPKASASVRLKAALAILRQASMPLPEPPQISIPDPANMHKNAQMHSPKTGRNEPCPCHSGRKFKQCCLNHPRPTHASGDPKSEHSQAA